MFKTHRIEKARKYTINSDFCIVEIFFLKRVVYIQKKCIFAASF